MRGLYVCGGAGVGWIVCWFVVLFVVLIRIAGLVVLLGVCCFCLTMFASFVV